MNSDFAENRLKLAEILYYKILENIMVQELKRHNGKDMAVSHLYDMFRATVFCISTFWVDALTPQLNETR